MADVERMRPGHWLGSVVCVAFTVLTPMVGWKEGHPARKKMEKQPLNVGIK